MIRVATYNARGMHAGRVIPLKAIEGPQIWKVGVKVRLPGNDYYDEREITSSGPVPLAAMYEIVVREINELLPEGGLVVDAKMDFYIKGRKR